MKQSDGEKRVETPKLYKNYITTKVVQTPNTPKVDPRGSLDCTKIKGSKCAI